MKPYLIMLPGWGMGSFVWSSFAELLKRDYELVFVEWSNINSLDEFKKIVMQIIEDKNIESFSLIGWSLGSLVAQEIAHIYSSNVDYLILISATSKFVRENKEKYDIGWDRKIVERMIIQLNRCPEETKLSFYNKLFSKKEKQSGDNIIFLDRVSNYSKEQSIRSLSLGLDYLINTDLRKELNVIDIPLLLIHGENDTICPLKAAKYIKNKTNNTKLEVIKDAGHIPFFTNYQKCYDIITNFTNYLKKDDNND